MSGAAIPPGWTARAALDSSREAANLRPERGIFPQIDLLEPPFPLADWPARDQAHRSACNAFAVVAAEELARYHAGQGLAPLSEEALHHAIAAVPTDELKFPPAPPPIPPLQETGESWLEQALIAMGRGGLRPAGGQSFATDPLLPVAAVRPPAPDRPALAAAPAHVHNIKAKRDALDWDDTLPEDQSVAGLFFGALARRRPVVAAFPLFEVPGRDVFTSAPARRFGRAAYPPPALAATLKPVAGHAVCLVGYEPRTPNLLDGWFVFRNSYGTRNFGAEVAQDARLPRAPAPGFGLIAATEVDRWCWEYLFRA